MHRIHKNVCTELPHRCASDSKTCPPTDNQQHCMVYYTNRPNQCHHIHINCRRHHSRTCISNPTPPNCTERGHVPLLRRVSRLQGIRQTRRLVRQLCGRPGKRYSLCTNRKGISSHNVLCKSTRSEPYLPERRPAISCERAIHLFTTSQTSAACS